MSRGAFPAIVVCAVVATVTLFAFVVGEPQTDARSLWLAVAAGYTMGVAMFAVTLKLRNTKW